MVTHVLIILVVTALITVGVAGTVLPFVPGAPLILLGIFIYAWYTGFTAVGAWTLVVLLLLTLCTLLLEHFSSIAGAKKRGASRWGLFGAFAGAIIGFFGGLPGIILGPLLGAVLMELLRGRTFQDSLRAGWGTFLGFLYGTLGKLIVGLIMVGIFLGRLVFG